jgi:hypothetical protein
MLITSDLLKERGEQNKVLNKVFLCSFIELFLQSVIATIVPPNFKTKLDIPGHNVMRLFCVLKTDICLRSSTATSLSGLYFQIIKSTQKD